MAKHFHRLKRDVIEEPSVNLTPLIDVVFVILIGFIMIAPLLEMDRVELAEAPTTSSNHQVAMQEISPIAIHVRQDNAIFFEGKLVQPQQLTELFTAAKHQYPQSIPQLFHDKKGYFGTYQVVKNALETAGFEQVDIVLKP